jgi:predicted transcriptional regulator of viral defense system
MAVKTPPSHARALPRARVRFGQVAARARPFISVAAAASVLRTDPTRAAKQLARWHEQGLLRRVRRGTYSVVPPAAVLQERVILDPWTLVPTVFNHAYVGGWSAAEHWDLTEQVFTTLLILTTDDLKRTTFRIDASDLRARHIAHAQWFGTSVLWREGTRVLVSDVHKTLIDMFGDPVLGGGIQHVAHCFRTYLRSDNKDTHQLLSYAQRLGQAPVFKRMGFLSQALNGPPDFIAACRQRVTLGLANLDSSIASPRVSKIWQLRLPRQWETLLKDGQS